ncbi:MAG: 4-alpha-glucanotransferase [Candidatus Algichlamydia australiensis]|nr:4-alpha-glucanotransferase [Chlamydiales bacterium]
MAGGNSAKPTPSGRSRDLKKMEKEILSKAHHGIAIPLSALRSKTSCGIGEFPDLIPLIDWCKKVDFDLIQILPINDSGTDPSPYNALSGSALHPIYIGLRQLEQTHCTELEKLLKKLESLNGGKRVAYKEVLENKMLYLERYYELKGQEICAKESFQNFCKTQDHLLPYALFKVLKENMQGQNWQDWPEEIRTCSHHHYKELLHRHEKEVQYHMFLQYLCYDQLLRIKQYASEKNILLKGDIPILISPDSADVWHHREFFDLTHSAGAPPDRFTPEGQYWGFPLYKWNILEQQDFAWWKTRLRYAENFFHLYRIDHVIGFFRIWAIKRGECASRGQFLPNEPWQALAQGRKLLEMLKKSSKMVPIGEDLGITFDGMNEVMQELKIPGTKVMRWEKLPPNEYQKLSMTCLSTHDSETLAQWWENEPNEAKQFAKQIGMVYKPTLSKEMRKKILHAAHTSNSLFHINLLGEYLALSSDLVWENLDDERINRPGQIVEENWTYRMRPYLEVLSQQSFYHLLHF